MTQQTQVPARPASEKQVDFVRSLADGWVGDRLAQRIDSRWPLAAKAAAMHFISERLPQEVAAAANDAGKASALIDALRSSGAQGLLKLLGWNQQEAQPYLDGVPARVEAYRQERARLLAEQNAALEALTTRETEENRQAYVAAAERLMRHRDNNKTLHALMEGKS